MNKSFKHTTNIAEIDRDVCVQQKPSISLLLVYVLQCDYDQHY